MAHKSHESGVPAEQDAEQESEAQAPQVAPAAKGKLSEERRKQLEQALKKKSQNGGFGSQGTGKSGAPHAASSAKGQAKFSRQKSG